MLAATDFSLLSCDEVIRRYEKNLLLSTPEGGRSKNHQEQHAKAVQKIQPFFDSCISTGAPVDQDTAMVTQKLVDDGQIPPTLSTTAVPGTGFGVSPMTVGFLVVAGLVGVWFLTRRG